MIYKVIAHIRGGKSKDDRFSDIKTAMDWARNIREESGVDWVDVIEEESGKKVTTIRNLSSLRDRIALAAVKRELGFRDGAQELLAGLFSDYRKGANVEAEILRVAKRFGLIDYATNMLKKIDDQKSAEWEKSNKTYHGKEGRN